MSNKEKAARLRERADDLAGRAVICPDLKKADRLMAQADECSERAAKLEDEVDE